MKKRNLAIGVLITALIINSQAFSAQFLFTPRSFVRGEYSDNIFLTEDDTEDDFLTEVSAGFTAELLGRTSGLTLTFDPGYVWYDQFSDRNTWRLPATLRAYTTPSRRTTLEFTNVFIRTEDPEEADRLRSDRGQVEEIGDTTVRRGREPYYRNDARLFGAYQFGEEDQVYARLRYGLLRNDDNFTEDNDNYRASAGLDYWFTQRFGGQFFGEFTRGKFDQPSDFVGDGASDFDNYLGTLRFLVRFTRHFNMFFQYDQIRRNFTSGDANDYLIYAPSFGFFYQIDEDTYLRLGPGYFYQDIDNESNNNNIFLNGEVSKTWNYRRGFINLLGLSGLTQNDFGAQNQGFQPFASIASRANYDFTTRWIGDASASYRFSYTPGGSEDTGDSEDQTDHRGRLDAGLAFLPTRWMNIRLGYNLNIFQSDVQRDYTENRVMLTITLQPDQPWRF